MVQTTALGIVVVADAAGAVVAGGAAGTVGAEEERQRELSADGSLLLVRREGWALDEIRLLGGAGVGSAPRVDASYLSQAPPKVRMTIIETRKREREVEL